MDIRSMHAKQQEYIDTIERLKGGAIDRLEWDKVYYLLQHLIADTPLVHLPITPSNKFCRGRVLSSVEKFHSIRTLRYPPIDDCKYFGRCNRPRDPILYAGVGTELVFSEIGAKQGDIVGLLHMSPTSSIDCIRLGALNLWRRTSGECLMHPEIKDLIRDIYRDPENITSFFLDAFISDYFSRPSDPIVYKMTSAYAAAIFDAFPEMAGILYDSVDHTAGACLAIKAGVFDSFLRPTEVQIVRITSYLGYGIFDFEQLDFADKFSGETILWN